ncbi:MAG: thioredoxin family protein [Dehalococcoidia bacterium]|nr:thioredoxin family protein [Chloroflexota bacterium]
MLARLAHAMALENKLISADVVEVQEFPNLARLYNVSGVPKTVINDVVQFVGSLPEDQFLEKVMQVGYREPEPAEDGA